MWQRTLSLSLTSCFNRVSRIIGTWVNSHLLLIQRLKVVVHADMLGRGVIFVTVLSWRLVCTDRGWLPQVKLWIFGHFATIFCFYLINVLDECHGIFQGGARIHLAHLGSFSLHVRRSHLQIFTIISLSDGRRRLLCGGLSCDVKWHIVFNARVSSHYTDGFRRYFERISWISFLRSRNTIVAMIAFPSAVLVESMSLLDVLHLHDEDYDARAGEAQDCCKCQYCDHQIV